MEFLIRKRVPRTIQWLMNVFLIYLLMFTCFRIATVIAFKPASAKLLELLPSFWLGLKYDLRWIAFILMPIALFSIFPKLSPYFSYRSKKAWTIYLGVVTLLVLFFYGADFGQFSYINSRLNADALVFMEEPKDNLLLLWQSYPVVWILIAIVGAGLMMTWMFRRGHIGIQDKNSSVHKFDYKRRWHLAAILLLGWFMYGFLTLGPLNVFRAFNLNDDFKSNLALNPLQNFFTSLRLTKPDPFTNAKPYYKRMSAFLSLPSTNNSKHPYARIQQPGSEALETQPNVVIVVGKSFSMYKSSMSGNVLNATPRFNETAKQGVFFERCFAPSYGTARGMFALLTGIPDVQKRKFSAKDPETSQQLSILSSMEDYEKFFFSGTPSQFNNFDELVSQISGMHIYRSEDFSSPQKTVWGLSDFDLLMETDSILSEKQKPFIAIVHTSNNQKPFQIAENSNWTEPEPIPIDILKENGFNSWEEYLSFSYMDFCYDNFLSSAKNRNYFKNTIFVFVGDHGLEGDAHANYPAAWTNQRLSEVHVPLLFYAPELLHPAVRKDVVSQIDILPSIAALLNIPVENTTLGRNIFSSSPREEIAFVMNHGNGWIGVVNNDFYFRKQIRGEQEELHPISNKAIDENTKQHLSELTTALYETSRWLLLHNKP